VVLQLEMSKSAVALTPQAPPAKEQALSAWQLAAVSRALQA
jgi:hypothetical protein